MVWKLLAGGSALSIVLQLILATEATFAQPNTILTGQEYLAFNQTHQVIFISRLVGGQSRLVEACASDLTVEEIADYLGVWLRQNPLNLNRPANLAFTQSLTDRCRQIQEQEDESATPVEGGSSTSSDEPEGQPTESSVAPVYSGDLLASTASGDLIASTSMPVEVAIERSEGEEASETPLDAEAETTDEPEPVNLYPRLDGVVKFGFFFTEIFQASSSENEYRELFSDTILNANFFITEEFYFNTAWRFLPAVFPPNPRRDRYFEDQALRLGALNFNFENDRFFIGAGKGTTFFSLAFRAAPGIWGRDVAERDIRVPARVGIASSIKFDAESAGNYVLSGGTFFLDTSVLNEPFFTDFGRPRLENGGPSNTESLESFFVTLDASNFEALPNLRTHLGFMRQKVNRLNPPGSPIAIPRSRLDDEYRTVLAAQWPISVSEDLRITPLVEYARFWNGSGIRNQYRDYLTTSVQLFQGNWNVALASTLWFIDNPNAADSTNIQFQVSGGYLFENGISLDAGYRFLEVDGILGGRNEGTHAVGLWFNYILGF